MEDDLYGGDLYGDTGGDFGNDDAYGNDYLPGTSSGQSQGQAAQSNHAPGSSAGPTGRDLFDDPPQHTNEAQGSGPLKSWRDLGTKAGGQPASDKWRTAIGEIASLCGLHTAGRDPDLHILMETIRRLKGSEHSGMDEVRKVRRREAALQMQLAERSLECLELRRELAVASAAADTSFVQLKQLMLDPAVSKEFQRLRSELEQAQADLKTAHEELTAVTFTQESKIGRQLMAKVRSLQEENEEMGRELAEGKAHAAEAASALARAHADDMRRAYSEVEEHCLLLEEEAEELQREIFSLRAHISSGLPPSAMVRPPGMMGGGGGPFNGRRFEMGGGFRGRGRGPPGMGFKRPFMDRDGPMGGRGGFLPGPPPMKRGRP